MRPLIPRVDPAPSRLSYRCQRLLLTPLYRRLLRIGLPVLMLAGGAAAYLADDARRASALGQVAEIRRQIETRPEFMVDRLSIEGASEAVRAEIAAVVSYDFPVSSFDLDLVDLRERIVTVPAVADAAVRIRQGGALLVEVIERHPVALWRMQDSLGVVDISGTVINRVANRAERPALPLVAGQGAQTEIAQALDLIRTAAPLGIALRGLVRVGNRRWDLVLGDGRRILLPERDPVSALERVIVLHAAQDMLERDIKAIDMRLSDRPTIRLSAHANEEWWRMTNLSSGTE